MFHYPKGTCHCFFPSFSNPVPNPHGASLVPIVVPQHLKLHRRAGRHIHLASIKTHQLTPKKMTLFRRQVYLSIYPSIHLSIYPSIYLSIYLSVYLSIYLSIYIYIMYILWTYYVYIYITMAIWSNHVHHTYYVPFTNDLDVQRNQHLVRKLGGFESSQYQIL